MKDIEEMRKNKGGSQNSKGRELKFYNGKTKDGKWLSNTNKNSRTDRNSLYKINVLAWKELRTVMGNDSLMQTGL